MDKPGLEKLKKALFARLYYSETNGLDYSSMNKNSSATGAFQFLWDTWGPTINKFAKEQGFDQVDRKGFAENPNLQDAFFDNYVEKNVYPFVKDSLSKNKRNLDIDEIAQLYHMHPSETKKYIAGGEFKPGGKNLTVKEYLKKGKKGSLENNVAPIRNADIMEESEIKNNVDRYFSEREKIKASNYHELAEKEQLRRLQQKYASLGMTDAINERAAERFAENKNSFNKEKAVFQEFLSILKNQTVPGEVNIKRRGNNPYMNIVVKTNRQKEILDRVQKSNPEMKIRKGSNRKGDFYNLNFKLNDRSNPTLKYLRDGIKKFSGKDIFEDPKFFENNFEEIGITSQNGPDENIGLPLGTLRNLANYGEERIKDINLQTEYDQEREGIPTELKTEIKKDYDVSPKEKSDNPKKDIQKKTEVVPVAEQPTKATEEVYKDSDMLSNILNEPLLEEPVGPSYDKDNFKQEFPYDALAGAITGAIGLDGLNEKVPKRDEKVSAAILDYQSQMAKLSNMGLPPEVEAKLKNNLVSSYSLGIKNLTEASAGNRNLILGNQGQMDLAFLMGQNEIEIADFEAKNQALEKYGEISRYINEFDARRDISNKQLEQDMAFQTREAYGDLANQGFASMLDSIAAQKENGPGSARHMLSSSIRQDFFGYDPEMKDDGSGTVKGTRSWYERNVVKKVGDYNKSLRLFKNNYNSFTDKQKKKMEGIAKRTGDVGTLAKASSFIMDNDVPLDMSMLDTAIEKDDFSLLSNFRDIDPMIKNNEKTAYIADQIGRV